MGREVRCEVEAGGARFEAPVLLESDEVVVRGPHRRRVPFSAIRRAEVAGDRLLLEADGGTVVLHVGAPEAARWASRILSPPTLRQRLGVGEGDSVATAGIPPPPPELAAALSGAVHAPSGAAAHVFVTVADRAGLADVPSLAGGLAPGASLWVVYPKGRADPKEADVLAAGRGAGLVDVRTARVSATHTALRFTRRRVPVGA